MAQGSRQNIPPEYHAVPDIPRLMIFVDGENLVFRYQSMLEKGWTPQKEVTHIEDAVVWHERFTHQARWCQVLRATYYTYVVGDAEKLERVKQAIGDLEHMKHRNSRLPHVMTPRVFKKPRSSAERKGVDIQLTVDVLNHVHDDNLDAVLLMTGDGDYLPLIEEVKGQGKQCYIAALSDGLNDELTHVADRFYCLDHVLFPDHDAGC